MHLSLNDIITILTGFTAAIIGIIGNTWDKDKKGIRKLTSTGMIAVVLALIGLFFTVKQVILKNKKEFQLQQIAFNELDNETADLMQPFLLIISNQNDSSLAKHGELYYPFRSYSDPAFFDSLVKARIVSNDQEVEKIDFYSNLNSKVGLKFKDKALWEIFEKTFSENKSKIEKTTSEYKEYLPDDLTINIKKLLNSDLYTFFTEDLKNLAINDSLHNKDLGLYFWSSVSDGFDKPDGISFFTNLLSIRKVVITKEDN